MAIFSAPKAPAIQQIQIPAIPEPPKPDPEIEAKQKAELERAEKERLNEIQKRLREDTALFSSSGSGRQSLLTKGRAGFAVRSLLGGG